MRGSRRKVRPLLGALQLGLLLLSGPAAAQAPRLVAALAQAPAVSPDVAKLFPARPTGYLTDVAGVVNADAARAIEAAALDLRTRTGAEVAIVTLPTLGDREPEEVALAILRSWGVGAKAEIGDQIRNAGLVILLMPKPAAGGAGKIRIEVGNGLEGIVTDLAAARVRDAMRPLLASGDYSGGLLAGVQAVDQLITAGLDPRAPQPEAGQRKRKNFPVVLVVMLLVFVILPAIQQAQGGGAHVRRRRRGWGAGPYIGGGFGGGGFGGGSGWGGGGGGFGGFGGGGGGSGGGAGGDF